MADSAVIATHPRHAAPRLVLDPAHYEGPSTSQVVAPPPLGRMGRRMQQLAHESVVLRWTDLYAQLLEVAR